MELVPLEYEYGEYRIYKREGRWWWYHKKELMASRHISFDTEHAAVEDINAAEKRLEEWHGKVPQAPGGDRSDPVTAGMEQRTKNGA